MNAIERKAAAEYGRRMAALNAHRRTLRIVASQLRPGDRIVRAGARDQRSHRIIVTAVRPRELFSGVLVHVTGTTAGDPMPHTVFSGLRADLPIVIERDHA